MGNSLHGSVPRVSPSPPPLPLKTDNSNSAPPIHPQLSLSKSQSFRRTILNQKKRSRNVYSEILSQSARIRNQDRHNAYNPHRRIVSIAQNLPSHLLHCSKTIHVVNEFWLDNIEPLSEANKHNIAMVLHCHFFLKCPECRTLLQTADGNRVPSHTLKAFTTFSYVIRNLINPAVHAKMFKQLRALGKVHCCFENITPHIYEAMLEAFHYAMDERFDNKYTVRVRFCFTQLYRVIVDIMNGDDFVTFAQSRLAQMDVASPTMTSTNSEYFRSFNVGDECLTPISPRTARSESQYLYNHIQCFLGSLEDCLSDPNGSLYFKKYLQETFCVENFLFHCAVIKYKQQNQSSQRMRLGNAIIATFINIGSEKEVNLSYQTRNQILSIISLTRRMHENKEKYANLLSLKHDNTHASENTTELIGLQLADITNDAKENISEVVYTLGFTKSLFDAAYEEIFHLMKANSWARFKKAILEYCGDPSVIEQEKLKLKHKKEEMRKRFELANIVNDFNKRHSNENQNGNHKNGNNIRRILHKKRLSRDDMCIDYKSLYLESLNSQKKSVKRQLPKLNANACPLPMKRTVMPTPPTIGTNALGSPMRSDLTIIEYDGSPTSPGAGCFASPTSPGSFASPTSDGSGSNNHHLLIMNSTNNSITPNNISQFAQSDDDEETICEEFLQNKMDSFQRPEPSPLKFNPHHLRIITHTPQNTETQLNLGQVFGKISPQELALLSETDDDAELSLSCSGRNTPESRRIRLPRPAMHNVNGNTHRVEFVAPQLLPNIYASMTSPTSVITPCNASAVSRNSSPNNGAAVVAMEYEQRSPTELFEMAANNKPISKRHSMYVRSSDAITRAKQTDKMRHDRMFAYKYEPSPRKNHKRNGHNGHKNKARNYDSKHSNNSKNGFIPMNARKKTKSQKTKLRKPPSRNGHTMQSSY